MRKLAVLLTAVALSAGTAWAQEAATELEELRRQVRELRLRVEELSARVEKLEKEAAEPASEPPFAAEEEWEGRGPNLRTLRKIHLPQDPTREEVRQYVQRIVDASEHQNRASTSDPQVAMLHKVGSENVDILLEELTWSRFAMTDLYIKEAVSDLARPRHKHLILDHLAAAPMLASVVREHGWCEEAREILLSELEVGEYVPRDWLLCVRRLGDEQALEALKTYFVEGEHPRMAFDVLRAPPGVEELEGLVEKAWKRAKTEGGHRALDMAQVAVGFGHKDALARLIDFLARGSDPRRSMPSVRRAVLQSVEATGTNAELVRWYRQNESRIRWDRHAGKFRVTPED